MSTTISRDTLKFAVIDSDPAVASALCVGFGLRWPDSQIIMATAGTPGVDLVRDEMPQLVVADIDLPDIDGYEVIRRIRRFSDVPIIVLSTQNDEMSMVKALELGADDYILKPPSPLDFLARARAVLRRYTAYPAGQQDLPPYIAGSLIIDFARRQVVIGEDSIHVTPLEFHILNQLVRNEGRVVAIDALQRLGKDSNSDTSPDTIRKSVCLLRQKLDECGDDCQIINERGIGYRLTGRQHAVV